MMFLAWRPVPIGKALHLSFHAAESLIELLRGLPGQPLDRGLQLMSLRFNVFGAFYLVSRELANYEPEETLSSGRGSLAAR